MGGLGRSQNLGLGLEEAPVYAYPKAVRAGDCWRKAGLETSLLGLHVELLDTTRSLNLQGVVPWGKLLTRKLERLPHAPLGGQVQALPERHAKQQDKDQRQTPRWPLPRKPTPVALLGRACS